LAINAQSASWTYNYRQRGVDYYGKRHPQKTIKLGDPVTMTPQEARFRVEEIKAEVRAGGDPVHTIEQAKLKLNRLISNNVLRLFGWKLIALPFWVMVQSIKMMSSCTQEQLCLS
jgi:hypothetical protein